jgi:hypothetical protein
MAYEPDLEYNREALRMFNVMVNLGVVDGTLSSATTIALLKSAIAGFAVSEPDSNLRRHAQSAIQAASDAGLWTDALVSASGQTVAGIRAIATTIDPTLSATDSKCFAYSPRTGSV